MMNNQWKKAAALGLCTCVALASLAGCSKKEEVVEEPAFDAAAVALTVNSEEVPAGLLKFAVHFMQAQYETLYANFGYTGIINEDMMGDGTTLGDSIKESMTGELERLIVAEQHMDEYGVSLTDAQKAAAADAAAAFIADNTTEVLEGMGATQEIVERYLILQAEQTLMEQAMGADVDTEVSDEEAAQRRIHYTLFSNANEKKDAEEAETEVAEDETAALEENDADKTQTAEETEVETEAAEAETAEEVEPETEDAETREARAKAYDKALAMIELVKNGEDFETASAMIDERAYTNSITFGAEDSTSRKELKAATDGLADGTLVEEPVWVSSGYYVVYLDTQVDREATDERKEEIIEERRTDLIRDLYSQWLEDVEITAVDDVIAGIEFEFSLMLDYGSEEQESEAQTE